VDTSACRGMSIGDGRRRGWRNRKREEEGGIICQPADVLGLAVNGRSECNRANNAANRVNSSRQAN
jgi:hypothetical protein